MGDTTLDDLREEISIWQAETFTQSTALSAAKHLLREAHELVSEIEIGLPSCTGPHSSAMEELADIFFLTIQVESHLKRGLRMNLPSMVDRKLRTNKARTWQKPDADGVVEHVR